MAILANQPKDASMDLGLCVTFETFGRRAGEDLVGMAVAASQVGMPTIQDEEAGMIEVLHPVCAIMAVQASWAEVGGMFKHEGRVVLLVTLSTGSQVKSLQASRVAGDAGDGRSTVIELVLSEVETGIQGMIESHAIQDGGDPALRAVAAGA